MYSLMLILVYLQVMLVLDPSIFAQHDCISNRPISIEPGCGHQGR